jgi:ATPase subunit of ABC transporter with duplicated ATPase domains
MQNESSGVHDYGTNCLDCERYKQLGDVCVVEHEKKFLWEYCRDFQPLVVLPDYKELMRTVKQDQALERQKAREKRERDRKKRLKERLEKREQKRKERRARLKRISGKKKRLELKRLEKLNRKQAKVAPKKSAPEKAPAPASGRKRTSRGKGKEPLGQSTLAENP